MCLLLVHLKGQICNAYVSVGLSSIQLLSRGRILKTEQNSPIVTVERRIDTLASLILLLHSAPAWRDILISNIKYVQILIWPPVDLTSDPSCCPPSTTVVTPQVLSAVVNRVWQSEPVVNRPQCWWCQSRTGGRPAFFTVPHSCNSDSFLWCYKSAHPLSLLSQHFTEDRKIVVFSGNYVTSYCLSVEPDVLSGHTSNLRCCLWLPQMQRVVSTSDDKTVRWLTVPVSCNSKHLDTVMHIAESSRLIVGISLKI